MTTHIPEYAMLIDGDWVAASDGQFFDSTNPATGDVWARIPAATPLMWIAPLKQRMMPLPMGHGHA